MKIFKLNNLSKNKLYLSKNQKNNIIEDFEKYGILKFSNISSLH